MEASDVEIEKSTRKHRLEHDKECPGNRKFKKEKQYVQRIIRGRLVIGIERHAGKRIRIPSRTRPRFPGINNDFSPGNLLAYRIGNKKIFEGNTAGIIPGKGITPRVIQPDQRI